MAATVYENILRRVKAAKYVQYINGVLLDDKDNPIAISTGEPGGESEGEPGQSAYALVRYASDANGTGYSADPSGKTHWAVKTSDQPITDAPQSFTGMWYPRGGTPGNSIMVGAVDPTDADGFPDWLYFNKTSGFLFGPKASGGTGAWGAGVFLGGAPGKQGDKGGLIFKRGTNTEMDDPGFGWMRFSIDTLDKDDTGFWALSQKTIRGQQALDFQRSWQVGSKIPISGNQAENITELVVLEITSIEEMDLGIWLKFGFKVIQGGTLTGFLEFSVMHQSIFGLEEVLNNNVARFDELGNLIDKNSTKQSGIEHGTFATMLAKNMTDFNRQFYLVDGGVRGSGMRYRGTGLEAIADGAVDIYDDHPIFKYIFPDTQATAIANNGGKVQITANAHLLTAGNAVSADEPVCVSISAWTGTGVPGWYKILSVDGVNTYTIDLAYAAGLGVPTLSLKNAQIALPISVALPKLGDYSQITIDLLCEYTGSTTAKQIFTRLNSQQFSALNQNTLDQITSSYKYGFRNVGAKNKQETLFVQAVGNPTGQSNASIIKMNQDTSLDSTLVFRTLVAAPNEMMCIRHVAVRRKW